MNVAKNVALSLAKNVAECCLVIVALATGGVIEAGRNFNHRRYAWPRQSIKM
jgi:hypothetical protein